MITSVTNSRVKNIELLQLKSKSRKEQGVFVIEGTRLFFDTPRHLLKEVYYLNDWLEKNPHALEGLPSNCVVESVSDNVMSKLADTKSPQGVVAVVSMPSYDINDILNSSLIMVLETLQDPGNMGTIFRTAEGAGVTGIIMNSTCVDLFSPKVVRSTMGSIYRMPFAIVSDLPTTVSDMASSGIETYAAHLKGSKIYTDFDYSKPTAFLIGNEGNGLSDELTQLANNKLIIPMSGKLESLNAAMASGILMYEAARQRRMLVDLNGCM